MTDKERIYVNVIPRCWDECSYARYEEAYGNGHYCILRDGICPRLSEETAYEHKKLIEDVCPLKTIQSIQNQKAVEALKKVRETINSYKSDFYRDVHIISAECVLNKIDQLIKEYGGKE